MNDDPPLLRRPHPLVIAIGLAAGALVALGLTRFAYALLLPAMRSDLDWSFAAAGGVTTANAIGYVVGAATGAWWSRRFGGRAAFVGGMVISAIALLLSAASGEYAFLMVVRFVGGVATAVVFVVGAALASHIRCDSAKQSAIAVSVYMAGVGVGVVLSGIAVPAVLTTRGDAGWPAGWLVLGVLAVLAIWPAVMATRHVETTAASTERRASMAFLAPTFAWYLLYGAGYVAYMTFVVALLDDEGLSEWTVAAFFIVLGLASVTATVLVWGPVIAALSARSAPALVTLTVMTGVLPLLLWHGPVAAFVSAVIFGAGFMAGPATAAVTAKRTLPAASWTAAIAGLTVAFSVGQSVGPVVSGALSDSRWGITGGLWLSVALLAIAATAARLQSTTRIA